MSIIQCEHNFDCFNLWKKGKQEMEANITIHNAFNFSWLVEKTEAWFFPFFFFSSFPDFDKAELIIIF